MNVQFPLLDIKGSTVGKVDYGECILPHIFPNTEEIVVVQVPPGQMPPAKVGEYVLSHYGASVKMGRVAYAKQDIGAMWAETSEQLAYLGALVSSLRTPPYRKTLRVLVVKDGQCATGDGCGFADMRIVKAFLKHDRDLRFTRLSEGLPARVPSKEITAGQFRFVGEGIIGKGMVLGLDLGPECDMILPESCIKIGNPGPGAHVLDGWLGIRDWAMPRRCSVSYQAVQWFSWKAVYEDLLPSATIEAGYMADTAMCRVAMQDWLGWQAEDEARMSLELLMAADKHGLMMSHPWVQSQVHRLMRLRWIELATSGGFSATALKAIPDDTLDVDEINAPDLPEGDMLVFRYPLLNHKGIRLVHNYASGNPHSGTVAMSHECIAAHQGDFDGDDVVVWPAEQTPHMACEVAEWHTDEAPTALVKERRHTPLERRRHHIANIIRNTSQVGLAANLITRAHAAGRDEQLIYDIGDQLQAAIDSVKWNVAVDVGWLRNLSRELPALDWLTWRYNARVFDTVMPTPKGQDTISAMWRDVGAWFKPPKKLALDWRAFLPMVEKVDNAPLVQMVQLMMQRLYTGPVAAAMRIPDAKRRMQALDHACGEFRRWAEGATVSYRGRMLGGLMPEMREPVFRILWQLSHQKGNAAVFVAFMDRVIDVVSKTDAWLEVGKPVVKARQVLIPTSESAVLTGPIVHSLKEEAWTATQP